MAGFYPDVPSRRMAWDADGTVVLEGDTVQVLAAVNAANKTEINDEESVSIWLGSTGGGGYLYWIFPELRDLDGFFGASLRGDAGALQTSVDTTNGRDGSWVTQVASYTPATTTYSQYRTSTYMQALSVVNIRGFRWAGGFDYSGANVNYPQTAHIYGTIATGETPDRLLYIDELTGLEYTLPIDWGDVPRGTVHDRELRIKNNSSGLTANTITLSFEDLYLGSSSWYTIKETGGAFATTLGITSIGAGVTYPAGANVITVRNTVPDDETLGLHAARLKANTTSWT